MSSIQFKLNSNNNIKKKRLILKKNSVSLIFKEEIDVYEKPVNNNDNDISVSEYMISDHNDLEINKNIIERSEYLKLKGCTSAENGDMSLALKYWNQALLLTPTDGYLYELRAQGFLSCEKWLYAIKSAEKCVEILPKWSEGYITLARARREMGEISLAIDSYHHAREIDKDLFLIPNEDGINEALEELNEMELLQEKMLINRNDIGQNVTDSTTSNDIEANTCIFNLTTRVAIVSCNHRHTEV
jgi:tetratricopeptide (TPR) repeat protein